MNKNIDVSFAKCFGLTFFLVAISGFFLTYLLLANPSALWYIFIPTIIVSAIFFSLVSLLLAASVQKAQNINYLLKSSLIISGAISIIISLIALSEPTFFLFLLPCSFISVLIYTFSIQWIVFKAVKH